MLILAGGGGPPLPHAHAWPSPGITSDSLRQRVHRAPPGPGTPVHPRLLHPGWKMQEMLGAGAPPSTQLPSRPSPSHTRPKRAGPGHLPYRVSCLAGQGSPLGMAPEPVPAPTGGAAAARGPGRLTWGLLCPHLSLGVSWEGRDQSSRPRGRDRSTPTGGPAAGHPAWQGGPRSWGRPRLGEAGQGGVSSGWATGTRGQSQPEGGHFLQRVPPTDQPGPQEAGQGGHCPPWTEASHCRPLHGGEPRHTQYLGGRRPGSTHPLKMH